MSWTETYNKLNPTAQQLYNKFAAYQDKGMWSEKQDGQSQRDSNDKTYWKADSGSNSFILSPEDYKRYNAWYKEEQAYKKEQTESAKKKGEQKQETTQAKTSSSSSKSSTQQQKKTTALVPKSYKYTPTTEASNTSSTVPSVFSSASLASPTSVSQAPLMSVSGSNQYKYNDVLKLLAGLLSGSTNQ